jgi:hypothetical protein
MKRGFDKLLSDGKGKQLIWLLGLTVCVFIIAIVVSVFAYDGLAWQQVIAVLLDPGCYGNSGWKYDWLLLPLAMFSLVFLSGLLVSTFTNVVENISESVRMGRRRYDVNGHTLIIGAGRQLAPILEALKESQKEVVVMSEERPTVQGNYIYYCGKRDNMDDLRSARPEYAKTIYIIGEDNESDHDSKTIKAINLLQELTKNSSQEKIYCYATLLDRVSSEVYEYSKQKSNGKLLLVDVINDYEYLSQLLMFNTDFLPIIKAGDHRRSHIVIYGNDHIAQNVAYTAAHISHYATFKEGDPATKTCITIIGEDMRRKLDNLIAARPALFEMSVYTYIDANGNKEVHTPKHDFLDIEWQFVDTYSTSQLARDLVTDIHNADNEILTIVVANENPAEATRTVLHLPREVYSNNIAVYMEHSADVIALSKETNMYGKIVIFGAAGTLSDPLFKSRSIMGQRVNFVYDQEYIKSPNEEVAWYSISESNKYSSIYCAIAMPMRERCFDMNGDRTPIYEAEHRRWMMSELLMGWEPRPESDPMPLAELIKKENKDKQQQYKSHFIHYDIVPFLKLPETEQIKDKNLIDAMPHIIHGPALDIDI